MSQEHIEQMQWQINEHDKLLIKLTEVTDKLDSSVDDLRLEMREVKTTLKNGSFIIGIGLTLCALAISAVGVGIMLL